MTMNLAPLRFIAPAILIALGTLAPGCANQPQYRVSVSSFASAEATAAKKFTVLSGLKEVSNDDLEFREYARMMTRILRANGYQKTPSSEADLGIFMAYGVGEPRKESYSYIVPTYGLVRTGSTTTGTVSADGRYTAQTRYDHATGQTGTAAVSGETTVYNRHLTLDAVDLHELRQTGKIKSLWKIKITSTGASEDIRELIPAMLICAEGFIGKNSQRAVQVDIPVDNEFIAKLRADAAADLNSPE